MKEGRHHGTGLGWSIVNRYLNEGRKLGLSLILITPQAVGKGRKKDMLVLHQCGTRFYFRPLDHERREIVSHITTKEAERGKWMYHLASMKKGEFIACGILCRAGVEADMAVKFSTYMGTGQMEK